MACESVVCIVLIETEFRCREVSKEQGFRDPRSSQKMDALTEHISSLHDLKHESILPLRDTKSFD